jgi:hypothetical protein
MARAAIKAQRTADDFALIPVSDLTAGLDLRSSATLVGASRARRLRNWSLSQPGVLTPRKGWATHWNASLGSGRIQGAARIYLASSTFSLAAWSGSVYKPSDVGVPGSSVLASLHATNAIFFPYDRDLVAVFDSSSVPKKSTDGSTWTQMGISAPGTAPTASAVAGGSLTSGNTYEFSYSYQDDELVHYGNESATVQQAVAGANLTVRLAVTASADAQVDKIKVWGRDVTGGETIRRLVTTVANATANVDITSKTWTSTSTEAPTQRTVPPALSFGVPWKNRWWARHATTKTRLHFTEIFENQSWPSLYYIDIPFERGDEIAAVVPMGDALLVFGRARQIFVILGQTSLDFEVRPSAGAEAGILGPRAWAAVEGGVVHASAEGVYIFDGATDRLLSYDIDGQGIGWSVMVAQSTAANLEQVSMVYHRRTKEVRIAVPYLYPYGGAGEWVLDLARTRAAENTAAWMDTDRTIGGYVQWDGNESTSGNRGRLFSWSDTIGRMYEEDTGTSANGSDMVCEYEGSALATGLTMARFVELYGEYRPSSGTFSLDVRVDGRSIATPTIGIAGGLYLYGASGSTYGTATYGGAQRRMWTQILPLTAEGRTLSLRMTYRGTGSPEFFTYAVTAAAEPAIRGL